MPDNGDAVPIHLLRDGRIAEWNLWRLDGMHKGPIDLSDADLKGAELVDADLSVALLAGANLSDAGLAGANLFGANLLGAKIVGADLTYARLASADLTDTDLSGSNLSGATLDDIDLTRANLTRANLSGASLTRANLTRADLVGASLANATLTGVNLVGADLTDADFTNADLSVARLTRARLKRTNFTRANFANAILPGAALFEKATFRGATFGDSVRDDRNRQVSLRNVRAAVTEIRMTLPDEADPTDLAQIGAAIAALARLSSTVEIAMPQRDADTAGGAAVAIATQSPLSVDITTVRLHYGSDYIQWLAESWHWLEITGAASGGGLTVRDLLKRGDSKILAVLRTVFSRAGRDTLAATLDAKNDEQLAATRALVAKHNSDAAKHLADTAEHALRYFKAVEQFPPTSQEQARENIVAANHLSPETQQRLTSAVESLGPLLSEGLTSTTIMTTLSPDDEHN